MELLSIDRVAFTLFGLEIYWYAIFITFSIILDLFIFARICKKRGYDPDTPFDMVIALVPLAILFGRLFSVLFDADLTISDYFNFRSGGMSILGALIGGAIGLLIYCLIKKKNFFEFADILAPLVLIGQAIGRWGNFVNQEVYGQLVTNENFQWFPYAVYIESAGNWYQALFFYEFVFNLIGVLLLFSLFKFAKNKKGLILGTYLIYYGVLRAILETFRDDSFILRLGSAPISQIISAMMIGGGIALLIYVFLSNKRYVKKDVTVRVFDGE